MLKMLFINWLLLTRHFNKYFFVKRILLTQSMDNKPSVKIKFAKLELGVLKPATKENINKYSDIRIE